MALCGSFVNHKLGTKIIYMAVCSSHRGYYTHEKETNIKKKVNSDPSVEVHIQVK